MTQLTKISSYATDRTCWFWFRYRPITDRIPPLVLANLTWLAPSLVHIDNTFCIFIKCKSNYTSCTTGLEMLHNPVNRKMYDATESRLGVIKIYKAGAGYKFHIMQSIAYPNLVHFTALSRKFFPQFSKLLG